VGQLWHFFWIYQQTRYHSNKREIMSSPTSIKDLDLTPKPGKTYFNIDREWREEFIYFLMVDRFHDDTPRTPVKQSGRSRGIQAPDNAFFGGTIKGVIQNLDYIAGLGCTAIWLSPVFENNPGAYHGYNINNYLDIDPHFGKKEDLIDLVDAAHNFKKDGKPFPIRIILDVVINHSGNNWEYEGGPKNYFDDIQFSFGAFRRTDRPIPVELRNSDLYHRRGNINMSNFDTFPENQLGDISGLKDYENDDDAPGSELINILIKAHCYWIREADVDGFRVDAVKHMGELASSRFSSGIREYAYSLGKRDFFLFGEVATADDGLLDRYIGQNTSRLDENNTVFFGLDSVLDFRLAEGKFGDVNNRPVRDILKGVGGPETLFNRLEAQRGRALNRGEIGRYLVTFVDNHDSFWQPNGRFCRGASDEQVIGAMGFLISMLGTPCLYYGFEQGFEGKGGDNDMREAMFDKDIPGRNLLNTDCKIYKEIARIAEVMRTTEHLRFGRMYYRQISGNDIDFGFPFGTTYTLAFSRVLYGSEVLVAYNISDTPRSDSVIVDASFHNAGDTMTFLYPKAGTVTIQVAPNGARFVKVPLAPHEFVILQ
jgi:glycosidase